MLSSGGIGIGRFARERALAPIGIRHASSSRIKKKKPAGKQWTSEFRTCSTYIHIRCRLRNTRARAAGMKERIEQWLHTLVASSRRPARPDGLAAHFLLLLLSPSPAPPRPRAVLARTDRRRELFTYLVCFAHTHCTCGHLFSFFFFILSRKTLQRRTSLFLPKCRWALRGLWVRCAR